ncbi:hypothetical protein D3C72_1801880 [compost metagenome]
MTGDECSRFYTAGGWRECRRALDHRPTRAFISNPHRLKPMKQTAMTVNRWGPAWASTALLMAAVRNMIVLPADAAVPALLENSSIAAEMAAGRTRVTASALISIGKNNVNVVIALKVRINPKAKLDNRPGWIEVKRNGVGRFSK